MAHSSDKKDRTNPHKVFAEDEPSSDSDGLDILKTARRSLDLSQFIDGQKIDFPTSFLSGIILLMAFQLSLNHRVNPRLKLI
jgi:hypothetical protein